MSRAPTPSPLYRPMLALQSEVHDMRYLALRLDPTPPERRARLRAIDEAKRNVWCMDDHAIAAEIERLTAGLAYVKEDLRVDRGVIFGPGPLPEPYRNMA